jgi:anion-transporting  ArsA/GET3 family ATPase
MRDFKELINNSKIIISVGGGGVGKTTTSAAIALEAAIAGKKTIVLTIDPAKRLANSLGVESLTNKAQKIDLSAINASGELYAMMLDMKTAMDDMVDREGKSDEKKKTIFDNKIYQTFSTSLSGTQDFAAMEKLWEISSSNQYDLIVLDTPPTSNTLDFLTFPQRIFDTFDNNITKLMISMYQQSGSFVFKFFGIGTQLILKGISKFVGEETLETLSSFLFNISDLIDGMKVRSVDIFNLLRSEGVNFVIVTTPTPVTIKESLFFKEELEKYKLNFTGFIVNRYHNKFIDNDKMIDRKSVLSNIQKLEFFNNISIYKIEQLTSKLIENLEKFSKLTGIENKHLELLGDSYYVKIPFFEHDIYNIDGLLKISKEIFK